MSRAHRALSSFISRRRLMTGAALALVLPGVAAAQEGGITPPTQPLPALGPDQLPTGAVYIEADRTRRDGDLITAEATDDRLVTARTRGHYLRGRRLTYDLARGTGSAEGLVHLIDPQGTVVHASRLELDPDLGVGFAVDFATRTPDGSHLMAATAVRRTETVSELNHARFTPCPICDEAGRPKEPSISIQAETVVQDEDLRAILYRNAVFRVGGVPVLYLPVFAHPDPTVERASGLLIPDISYDESRGLSWEQPYLIVRSPSEDWLISPQVNTRVNPFLNLQWRRRFADGTVVARAGYTYERNFGDFDTDGDSTPTRLDLEENVRFGEPTSRSYLLAWGRFDPEGPWRWGFTAERVSDKTLFDRYDVDDPYQDRGLYYGDQRRLISQLYVERQTARSYVSAAAFAFQSLRIDPTADPANDFRDPFGQKIFEREDSLPVVAPLVEARYEPDTLLFGGRLRLRSSFAALTRRAFVGAPVLPVTTRGAADVSGVDSRRLTAQLDWRRALISAAGVRWEPFFDVRIDSYGLGDIPAALGGGDEAVTRARATAGVDIAWPLIRRFASGDDLVVEPMAQLSVSNAVDDDRRIPNEDSQTLELDESSLFRVDRFPGYDLQEGGARLTLGARATYRWEANRQASLFLGRSFRAEAEPRFLAPVASRPLTPSTPIPLHDPTGLAGETSDWVVQGSFTPSDRIRGWGHATVADDGSIRRAEAAVDGRWGRRNAGSVTYILDRSNPVQGPENRNYEFVQLSAQQFLWRNWGVTVTGVADLQEGQITRSETGLLFDDDCFRFELGWRRDNTRVRFSGSSEGPYVRLTLATFGGSSYGRSNSRW